MKMITAIVNKRDAGEVCESLSQAGFSFTKMATVGGFLTSGNTTLLIGTEDHMVSPALEIIRTHCSRRVEPVRASDHTGNSIAYPANVTVGGATVFVTDVEHFEKM